MPVAMMAIKRNVVAVIRREVWNLGLTFLIIIESGGQFVIIV
jgi:hypothetical protein